MSPGNLSSNRDIKGSGNHLHVPSELDHHQVGVEFVEQDNNFLFHNHSRVRRHRSLPSPTFCGNPKSLITSKQQHRSSSFRLPVS